MHRSTQKTMAGSQSTRSSQSKPNALGASSSKHIPQPPFMIPFNFQFMDGLSDIVANLLQDPLFCRLPVLVPFMCATFGVSFSCGFAVMVLINFEHLYVYLQNTFRR